MFVLLIPVPLTRINNLSFFGIGTTISFFLFKFFYSTMTPHSQPQWHQGLNAVDSVMGSSKKDWENDEYIFHLVSLLVY